MVEIIAGVWLTSFTLSFLTTLTNFYFVVKQLRSRKLKVLNENLRKANFYWSNNAGDVRAWEPGAIEQDAAKTKRNALLLGLLGFASLPGFLLLAVIVLSLRVLARSRKERAVFASDLALDPHLDSTRVSAIVDDLKDIM